MQRGSASCWWTNDKTWSITGSRISETGGDGGCQTRAAKLSPVDATVPGNGEAVRRGSGSRGEAEGRVGGREIGPSMEIEGFGIAGRLAIGVAVAGELANRRRTRRDEKDEEAVSPQSDIIVGKVLWWWVMKFEVGSWGDVAAGGLLAAY